MENGGMVSVDVGIRLERWRLDWFVNRVDFELYCNKRKMLKPLRHIGGSWVILMLSNLTEETMDNAPGFVSVSGKVLWR